ncbi:MAG TPA: response regulator [Victivallales bacterium]|nr:response regulator [Victivallales bacterium]
MTKKTDNLNPAERIDKLLSSILSNIGQAKSILGNGVVAKLLDDAESACVEAKEANSSMLEAISESGLAILKDSDANKKMESLAKTLNGKRILILEDEKPVVRMLKNLLERLGCVIKAVDEGQKAVQEYKTSIKNGKKFDVVILDMIISGSMGGVECFKELAEIDPDVNAVMSSGYCGSIAEDVRKRFKTILPKPYTYGELVETLAKACEKQE